MHPSEGLTTGGQADKYIGGECMEGSLAQVTGNRKGRLSKEVTLERLSKPQRDGNEANKLGRHIQEERMFQA